MIAKMRESIKYYIGFFILFSFYGLNAAQCLQSPLAGSTWQDNTKGTLTFTTSTMTGWTFRAQRTSGTTTVSSWTCLLHNDTYLVFRTTTAFSVAVVHTNRMMYGYLCMGLTKLSPSSYRYYQLNVQEASLGYERLRLSTSGTLTNISAVCNQDITVPPAEYHVIVKTGQSAAAAITCPDSLLHVADYTVTASNGTQYCGDSTDRWDVCSNLTQMTFDYTTCTTQVAFSAGGSLLCVDSVRTGGYDFTTVYNKDTSITTSTSRFACLSTSGVWSTVVRGNCSSTQVPSSLPLAADGTTVIGHLIEVNSYFESCANVTSVEGGLSAGAIAGIVIGVLLIPAIISAVIIIALCILAARLIMIFLIHYTDIADHIPVTTGRKSPDGLVLRDRYLTLTEPIKGNEFPTYKLKGDISLKDPRYKWKKRIVGEKFELLEREKERTKRLYGTKGKPKTKKVLTLTEPEKDPLPEIHMKPTSPSNVFLKNGHTLPPIKQPDNKKKPDKKE